MLKLKKHSNIKNSKDVAKKRLEHLLVNDRFRVTNETLEMIKSDFINIVNEYMEINEEDCTLFLTDDNKSPNSSMSIIAVLPITKVKK